MRLFKGFIIAIAGLFIMITLISLLIPSKVMVARGVVIHVSADKIFPQISRLSNWKNWQPVFKGDSVKVTYSADSTSCQWETNGKPSTLVIDSAKDNAVYFSLQQKGETDVKNILILLPLPDSNSVQVEWRAVTKLRWYPWEKFYGIFIDKLSGPGYDAALNSLKEYVEKN
jgi:hypothetical protein